MPNIFDTINKMYNGKEADWHKATDYEKSSAYYLLNRCMSMINPVIAAELSRVKISPLGVMEHWQSILSKLYLKTPGCFYQVNPKKKKEQQIKKAKTFIPKQSTIEYYCDIHSLDSVSFNELEEKFKNELYDELQIIEKERSNI